MTLSWAPEKFGERIFDTIENDSGRLADVEGIGPKRRQMIKAGWVEQKVIRQIMVFLHSKGEDRGQLRRLSYRKQCLAFGVFGAGLPRAGPAPTVEATVNEFHNLLN